MAKLDYDLEFTLQCKCLKHIITRKNRWRVLYRFSIIKILPQLLITMIQAFESHSMAKRYDGNLFKNGYEGLSSATGTILYSTYNEDIFL